MKRPKKTKVQYNRVTEYYSSYKCPHCKTYHKGAGISRNVTRFLCLSCGEEIIVEGITFKKG